MKKTFLLIFYLVVFAMQQVIGQNIWTQKANFPGGLRSETVGFSIGNKGYMTLGIGNDLNDLWEYDTTSNSWAQKASFAGLSRSETISFVIGNKAYIGSGLGSGYCDFWEYEQTTDIWKQDTSWGYVVQDHSAFSIGNKGYICGGWGSGHSSGNLWEYDPSNGSWTQKANFANGLNRYAGVTFTIGNYAYMGTGADSTSAATKDFWKYDPTLNLWTQIADFAGNARREAVAFSINGRGYVGTGLDGAGTFYNDFWEYNPVNDTWVQVANLPTNGRAIACAFSIGNKGYVGTGTDAASNDLEDFWEFSPSALPTGMNHLDAQIQVEIFPNPSSDKIYLKSTEQFTIAIISDLIGRNISTIPIQDKSVIDVQNLSSGNYIIKLVGKNNTYVTKFIKSND